MPSFYLLIRRLVFAFGDGFAEPLIIEATGVFTLTDVEIRRSFCHHGPLSLPVLPPTGHRRVSLH